MRADGSRNLHRILPVLTSLAALATIAAPRTAAAFCRTTTCQLPPSFSPSPGSCAPPDYDAYCASLTPPQKVLPIFWSNACVSYDIQKDASDQVPLATATTLFAKAFGQWTSTTCGASGTVSISTTNLGPVDCDQVQYSSDQGNQHVIIFHDDSWPHVDDSVDMVNTLALTTITFNPDTGEIYDADMEVNSTKAFPLALADPVPSNGYDFQSIIQHETGHFLGLAHSGDTTATMFAHYEQGSTSMRDLASDDKSAICSTYLPGGQRAVDPSVSPSGAIEEATCDPTPRHGFQSSCAQPQKSKCSLSSAPSGGGPAGAGAIAAGLAIAASVRRSVRRKRRSAGRLGRA
ncbi:MAG TPA: matrixin family metalloprotease [Polyangiaceae bacterium]|jgi:hypothetical protein|nr:matrixin family metalloprotease [Polyangiaceae bacterium]